MSKKLKTLDDFTEEIKAKIPEYQAKCMDLSGTEENGRKYVEKIYEMAGYKKPLVFFAKNQTEYKILFEIIPQILGGKEFDSSLYSSLYSSLSSSLYSSLSSSLNSSLSSSLSSELNKDKIRSSWAWYCSIYSRIYFTWYKFIQDEFNIDHKYKEDVNELYYLIINSTISRCWFTEHFVLVLNNPSKVNFVNDQLHNVHGSSYEYENGEKYYHVIGRQLSEEVFNDITNKTYTPAEFFKEENEDVKAACIAMMQELHGDTFVFDFFRSVMKEVDTYKDVKDSEFLEGTTGGMNIGVYTLFKGEVEGTEISYVRCYCPSTDRMFFLGVEPKYNNAKDAIASLYRVPVKLKDEIKYIQRQGERFSTVFTDKGMSILEEMSKEDIQNTTTIDGNAYFSRMKYEY